MSRSKRWTVPIILAVWVVVLFTQGGLRRYQPPARADETSDRDARLKVMHESLELEKNGKYAEAYAILQRLPRPMKSDYFADLRSAWLLSLSGNPAAARKQYEAAVRERPKSLEARLGLTNTVVSLGMYADAETAVRSGMSIDADNYTLNLQAAFCARMTGKFKAAESINRRMLQTYPADPGFGVELALSLHALRRTTDAVTAYRNVLIVNPNSTYAVQGYEALTGKKYEADPIATAVKASFDSESTTNYAEAESAMSKAIPPKGLEYFWKLRSAWLAYLAGDYTRSINSYDQALKASPKSIEAALGLSLAQIAAGKYADCEQTCRFILKHDTKNYYGSRRLAYVLRLQNKLPEADKLLTAMLEYYPTDWAFLTEAYLTRKGLGKEADARKAIEQLRILQPESAKTLETPVAVAKPATDPE